jgi:hypothetical protein
VVRVADWSCQQAHLRDEEGHPVNEDETGYWLMFLDMLNQCVGYPNLFDIWHSCTKI